MADRVKYLQQSFTFPAAPRRMNTTGRNTHGQTWEQIFGPPVLHAVGESPVHKPGCVCVRCKPFRRARSCSR